MGQINLGKVTGTQIFAVTAATSTTPAGARVGDLILNAGTAALTIAGISTAVGGLVKITTLSPFAGTANGNIRGAAEPKNNMTASTDPKASDYSGYSPGSLWFNHTNGLFFVCKSISGTTAVWTCMAAGSGN